jgi:hypothetical protein
MQEEQGDQQAEATEEEPAAGAEESSGDSGEGELAAAVDDQAAQSSGTAAEAEPEVPDDASAKIQAAQEHIDNLNMDEEREAAKKAM